MGVEVTKSNSSQRADFVPVYIFRRGCNPAVFRAVHPEACCERVLAPFTRPFCRSEYGLKRGSRSAARALHSLPFRSIHDRRNGW